MEKIVFREGLIDYLNYLSFQLFEKEYFGFLEFSENYVEKIIDFIYENIEKLPAKSIPEIINFLGLSYIIYQANKNTSWYIFFEKQKDTYLITNIFNNHQPEIQFLNL